ncbi:hypothetical protein JW962_01385 [Candidatus Dojkabacteria bacterium]|nr:hypothetical protein [Candidatus Dojkabacteria bacterium]
MRVVVPNPLNNLFPQLSIEGKSYEPKPLFILEIPDIDTIKAFVTRPLTRLANSLGPESQISKLIRELLA